MNKEKYQKELDKLSKQIIKKYQPEKIILFGSLAEGNLRKGSDIDLLVIKKSDKDYWERAEEIAEIIDIDVPCDVLNITPKELKNRLAVNDFFIGDIINKGKVVYERA
ncbi:MAG: nucleotidyltransferase domain-containing protein [Patescibacteria group bacterium]|nr:nucleotidyltransferase domain-containing protein [Patescibacteria group bacterium]